MKLGLCLLLFLSALGLYGQARKTPPQHYKLSIRVYDKDTQENLDGVFLKYINLSKPGQMDSVAVLGGYVNIKLDKGDNLAFISKKSRYLSKRANFNAACYEQDPAKVFCLVGLSLESVAQLSSDTDLINCSLGMKKIHKNTILKTLNIYYDLNKTDLRSEAIQELDAFAEVLQDNADVLVEVGSHTDSRASKEFNTALSQKRAEVVAEYLVNTHHIARQRITAKGYGETQLLNHCTDGVKCSEEEHARNRRTEIRITGYKVNGVAVDID